MHSLSLGVKWHGRRTRQLGALPSELEASHWRLVSARARWNVQVNAAHAHQPSTDLMEPGHGTGPGSTVTAAAGGVSVFSYLGLGSRNSDSVEDDGNFGTDGDATRASAAAAAGWVLLERLGSTFRFAKERLGSSLEQVFFDGVAEGLPGWSVSQMAGALMALALLHRRPDDGWLHEYWSLTSARMCECTTADLAMLSFGVSELHLMPPPEWTAALLAATLRLAELPPDGLVTVVGTSSASLGDEGHGDAAGDQSFGMTLQQLLHKLTGNGTTSGRQLQPRASLGSASLSSAAVARRQMRALPATLGKLLPHSSRWVVRDQVGPALGYGGIAAVGGTRPLAEQWLSTSVAASVAASSSSTEGAGSKSASGRGVAEADGNGIETRRPLNSAYDMEDIFGGDSPETSSSIAELVLEPVQALWGGLQRATAVVSSAWRRSRSASELVTVVYNLTAAGMSVEAAWLARFLGAMRPCLGDLSGDDLHCLLVVATEAVGRGDPRALKAGMSRDWQAVLFARMDGINWALQGQHLVGCLGSISALGLRPPAPWVRRQLRSLQPGLQFLPNDALAELGGVLPGLPLYYEGEARPSSITGAVSTPMSAHHIDPWVRERVWLERWLAEYRAAVLERCATMDAADLLAVIAGVAAVMTTLQPLAATVGIEPGSNVPGCAVSSPPALSTSSSASLGDVASLLLPRSGEVSYVEWRRAMVNAVATRLREASLAALCEAWQVLADASSGDIVDAMEADGHLDGLRELVASRLAVHQDQLSTSDVAPVLSSLAAAGLPLPAPTLDALLTSVQPLLPALTSSELVTVALSLVRLSYKPNLAWQAAFCAASRRRLGLMTPPQRCSLLVASASLGLHLPDPWVKDFFAVSERGLGEQLDGMQLANLLWAVSCVASEPAGSWLEQWEYASMPRLHELGPNMLAVVLKAMSTLHYQPSRAWQSAFFAALQRRLFVAGAAQLTWDAVEEDECNIPPEPSLHPLSSFPSSSASRSDASTTLTSSDPPQRWNAPHSSSSSSSGSGFESAMSTGGGANGMLSSTVTAEALNSLVYSLASLDLSPPAAWLDELADAIRCKLSLLSTLDLSVVLAYLVARSHRPNDEWWESFLEALESRFDSLSASEMSSLLVMLNALKVSPAAQWLDTFCTATQSRLGIFQPSHLLQVLSCLHLFRHRPGQSWMAAYTAAVEGQLPRFTPTELARAMMLLDNLNQRPSAAFMLRFYDFSRPGLAQLDTQELVNVAWAVVSCSTLQPDIRWTEALVEAARPRLASLQQPQLRVLVAALGQMQRGSPCVAAEDFLAFAREFLVM
ncbi:hypothetical protein VaNZ11_008835 [Volvox africanus]|uniref:Uncharacterized protein n=1 Tax=Volvox africanus TaxID=51714 RepID=A0ABQ5S724_9CHLO|nr:hypothetical protein VaNZ11_008835 [Volvox africanus]